MKKRTLVRGLAIVLIGIVVLVGYRIYRHHYTLKGHAHSVLSVAFSPDGKRIVSGSWDHTLKVWDAQSGQETLTLKGHAGDVRSVAFSPDGQRIVSGSWGFRGKLGEIKVWKVEAGEAK